MKGKRQIPRDDRADRQRRAGDLIHRLVARLDASASMRGVPAPQPLAPIATDDRSRLRQMKDGPTPAPAGRRSGEGASSVLPYLSQHLQSKPGKPEE